MTEFLVRNIAIFRWALDDHNERCTVAAKAFALNPEDFEALGETELWGLKVESDERVRVGFVRIRCDGSAWRIEDELESYVLKPERLRPAGHPLPA